MEECKRLASGIPGCLNIYTASTFTLRVWPILYSRDGPARSDTIGIVRPGKAKILYGQYTISGTRSIDNTTYYIPYSDTELRGHLPAREILRADIIQ